jgi:hypothetical protein
VESHTPLFRPSFGVFQVGGVFDNNRGGPGVARVLHAPMTGRFSSFGNIWASMICVFFSFLYFLILFTVYLCNGL